MRSQGARSIGGANYRSFMALLVAALALAGLQAAMSALQLAASFHAAQHAHWPGGVHVRLAAQTSLRLYCSWHAADRP